jgi:hypothetical protein
MAQNRHTLSPDITFGAPNAGIFRQLLYRKGSFPASAENL